MGVSRLCTFSPLSQTNADLFASSQLPCCLGASTRGLPAERELTSPFFSRLALNSLLSEQLSPVAFLLAPLTHSRLFRSQIMACALLSMQFTASHR